MHIVPYIENKLKLKVNKEKTSVPYIRKINFLGYGFYSSKTGIKARVHSKSISKMRNRIREITTRNNVLGCENLKKKLKKYVIGWINYFKLADMKNMLATTDQWLRRRMRMYIWKQWKKVKTRYIMLRKLGLNHNNAKKYLCTRKAY